MSNLTIDQILAERRQEETPDIYGFEKEASLATHTSEDKFPSSEITKMASKLKSGVISGSAPRSFNEKMAEALIFGETISTLEKEASSDGSTMMGMKDMMGMGSAKSTVTKKESTPEKTVCECKENCDCKAQAEKVASFIMTAYDSGNSEDDISDFVEKTAAKSTAFASGVKGLKKMFSSTAGKAAAGAGVVGGAAYGGKEYGEGVATDKAKKIIPKVLRMGRLQGYRAGARRGYLAGTKRGFSAGRSYSSQSAKNPKGKS